MPKAYCPNCDAVINKDNPQVGAMLTCSECHMELEIISVDLFEVDFPLDYDEEWEDEEDE